MTEVSSYYLEERLAEKIQQYQLLLNDIRVYDTLLKFGDLGHFTREFFEELDWLKTVWLDDEKEELFDAARVASIEDRLVELPYEMALSYSNEWYKTSTLDEICQTVFKEKVKWRTDPSIVMNMSKEDKIRIHGHFEMMCYVVLNVREGILYDIQSKLE